MGIPDHLSHLLSLVLVKSLSYCWFEKVFISCLFLKDNFPGKSILGWQVFSFISLPISSQSLLAYQNSSKESTDILKGLYLPLLQDSSLYP